MAKRAPRRGPKVPPKLTPQQNLQDKLRKLRLDFEVADRHRKRFLTALAHELSTSLAAVAYSAELLRQPDIAAEDRQRAADIVLEQITLIRRLVRDLGEPPPVQRSEFSVRKTPTDLANVARVAVEISRPLIDWREHALEVVMPPSPIQVLGDHERLVQVVTNLLINAARYTPEAGHICLSITQEGATAVLKVKDNGIGIPKKMLTRVFDLVNRLDSDKQKYIGGVGVGLAFVRRVVEFQGGTVEAVSEGEGHGSEFIVRLPLARYTRLTATDVAAVKRGRGRNRVPPEAEPPVMPVS